MTDKNTCPTHNMSKEEELAKEGWVKQTTIDEPRLSELVEMYKSLRFEVHLEPVTKEEMECSSALECMKCFKTQLDRYKTIYTKPKKEVR